MNKIIITTLGLILGQTLFAQISGNINYRNQKNFNNQYISVDLPSDSKSLVINIKGLANIKADTYVAVFSVTQVGKTAEEVDELINKRISTALNEIKSKKITNTYVDMISFVPMYEFETEKKIFSKRNYNEVPKGFELKKNIHIQYSNPKQLDDIIGILSKSEIYDLVKVDYVSNTIENAKKELMIKAQLLLQEKIKSYETILGQSFNTAPKQIADGYKIVFPTDMYQSYEAYNSAELYLKKSGNINYADKSATLYYQPIVNNDFDFVINPTIVEPVIQVLYEVKLMINTQKTEKPVNKSTIKEYILVTPNGELKNLNLSK